AYYFSQELKKHRSGPLGLMNSAWGGTSAESWLEIQEARRRPALQPILDRWDLKSDEEKHNLKLGWPFDFQYTQIFAILPDGSKQALEIDQTLTSAAAGVDSEHRLGHYQGRMPSGT